MHIIRSVHLRGRADMVDVAVEGERIGTIDNGEQVFPKRETLAAATCWRLVSSTPTCI